MSDPNSEILNDGLNLAMEFGNDWLMPVRERLEKKYPDLSAEQLDIYSIECEGAMEAGLSFIYKTLEKLATNKGNITGPELFNLLQDNMKLIFPWINNESASRLMSQGCYYAYKDGLDGSLV